MTGPGPSYKFYTRLARVLNSGQSRSVLLAGNVHDLFYAEQASSYVPLVEFLCEKCAVPGWTILVYELNGPIRLLDSDRWDDLKKSWVAWKSGEGIEHFILQSLTDRKRRAERDILEAEFDRHVTGAIGKPTMALEFLRQLTLCSRSRTPEGKPYMEDDLLIILEGADFLLPAGDGDISHLNPSDRRRVSIVSDWFADPGFLDGGDSVVLISEARSLVHPRVSKLPQVIAVDVPSPDLSVRWHYLEWFEEKEKSKSKQGNSTENSTDNSTSAPLWDDGETLARFTAGLSIQALRQLVKGSAHSGETLSAEEVVAKVEEYISSQLGEDVIEFKKPQHSLDDVVGFSGLKRFIRGELLPRFRSDGPDALPGAAVAGPIGGGKTFIFEAVAAALDMPVLVLKNIRSQWFGQTDVIFERLRQVLEALDKAVIFVDEADTQFGGVGPSTHATERRLTGKIQQMMSDPRLRGRIVWLLMTARIHHLSPDIRRPGRVGDLIIPVLDPSGEDRRDFVEWVLSTVRSEEPSEDDIAVLEDLTGGYSAAAFASLRSQLVARTGDEELAIEDIEAIVYDHIPPAIGQTRRYQTLQALVNCTRRSLLPDPDVTEKDREAWRREIRALEALGIG